MVSRLRSLLLTESIFIPSYIFVLTYRNVYHKAFAIDNTLILTLVSIFAFAQVFANGLHLLMTRWLEDKTLLVIYNTLTTVLPPAVMLVSPTPLGFVIESALLGFGNATQAPFQGIANTYFETPAHRNRFYVQYNLFTKIGTLILSGLSVWIFEQIDLTGGLRFMLAALVLLNALAVLYRWRALHAEPMTQPIVINTLTAATPPLSTWRTLTLSLLDPVILILIVFYGLSRTFDSFNSNYLNLYLLDVKALPNTSIALLQSAITLLTILASVVLLRTSAQSSAEYSLPLITAIGLLAASFVWLNTANRQFAVAGFVLLYAIGTSLSWPFTQAYFNHAVPKHKLSQLLSIRNMLAQLLSLGVFAALNPLDPWLQFKQQLSAYIPINLGVLGLMLMLLIANIPLRRRAARSSATV